MRQRYALVLGVGMMAVALGSSPGVAAPQLDTSFGYGGRVSVELGRLNSAHAVLVQPDGKILLAGSSAKDSRRHFTLLRFNPDGTPDPSFNGDGSVVTPLSFFSDEILAIGLLSDGRIIAAGYSSNGKDRDLALACYQRDGHLDRNFGDSGVVLTAIGNGNEELTALAIGKGDTITAVGATEGTAGRILLFARYHSDGQPDTSFGEGGISLMGVGEDASAEGVVATADGSYVLAGSYTEKQRSSVLLVAVQSNGSLDTTFGDKGVAVPAGSQTASEGYGITRDDDGRLYVAGAVGPTGKRDAALFRFDRRGQADTGFGNQGVLVTPTSKEDDVLYSVTVGIGGVAASGFTTDAGTRQFLTIAYPSDFTSAQVVSPSTSRGAVTTTSKASGEIPVQEVKGDGSTSIQIRELQFWNSNVHVRDLQILDSLSSPPDPATQGESASGPRPVQGRGSRDGASLQQVLTQAGRRVASFLLPEARAAQRAEATTAGSGADSGAQVVTTTFSAGESVSYAVTTDQDGNLVAVGSADGDNSSSIVAARLLIEDMVDRIVDAPGHRSSQIATVTPTEITRTSIAVQGEIAPAFGEEVVRRGVVFSVHPGPRYTGQVGVSAIEPGMGPLPGWDALAAFLLPAAVAADFSAGPYSPSGKDGAAVSRLAHVGEQPQGSGKGSFVATLTHLVPGTVYYIRAYAVTAAGHVYYGNQVSARTADACFVATASYGTPLHPAVGLLREFRDTFLLEHAAGKQLVGYYYRQSPPVADVIASHAGLRSLVRLLLLPCVGFSWLALHLGLGTALALVTGGTGLTAWATIHSRKRRHQP